MKFMITPTHKGQAFASDYNITRSLQDIYEQEIWEPGCSPLQVTIDTVPTPTNSTESCEGEEK